MKKSVAKATVFAALAIFIAGAVLAFLLVKFSSRDVELSQGESVEKDVPRFFAVCTNEVPRGTAAVSIGVAQGGEKKKVKGGLDGFWKDCIQNSSDNEDYKGLSRLLKCKKRMEEPETRLALLDALTWFEETAVGDALQFLDDEDERVAAKAAEVVTARIASIEKSTVRSEVYLEAMKKMKNSPDLDILVAELGGDEKYVVLKVVTGMEGACKLRPTLWKKLKEVYEESFDRKYTTSNDAFINYRQ